MENTIENKAKFFALYHGQKVAKSELHNDKLPCCKSFAELALKPENNFFLVLKDLSKISNEDAIEAAQLCSNYFPFNDDIECEIFQNLHGRKVV